MTATARVLVFGGRDFTDIDAVYSALDKLHGWLGIGLIIHGAARGVDSFAGQWAHDRGVDLVAYPAKWDEQGKGAGHIRNSVMLGALLTLSEGGHGTPPFHDGIERIGVAFPGGTGTRGMLRKLLDARVPVHMQHGWGPASQKWTGVVP